MERYKEEFIEFMVESDVLKFGEFTLKSGRKSPFFMNAGAYVTGSQLKRLGELLCAKDVFMHERDIGVRYSWGRKENTDGAGLL